MVDRVRRIIVNISETILSSTIIMCYEGPVFNRWWWEPALYLGSRHSLPLPCDSSGVEIKQNTHTHTHTNVRLPCCCRCTRYTLQITTILSGVTQERRGDLFVEEFYQSLIDPQALQFDTRREDLDVLFFSDFGTGYIYTVRGCISCCCCCYCC